MCVLMLYFIGCFCQYVLCDFTQPLQQNTIITDDTSRTLYIILKTWINMDNNMKFMPNVWGTRWRSWLRHCATNRKVAGSIPDGVIGIFHWHNPSEIFAAKLQKGNESNPSKSNCEDLNIQRNNSVFYGISSCEFPYEQLGDLFLLITWAVRIVFGILGFHHSLQPKRNNLPFASTVPNTRTRSFNYFAPCHRNS
jgi:hypothetical protein